VVKKSVFKRSPLHPSADAIYEKILKACVAAGAKLMYRTQDSIKTVLEKLLVPFAVKL
jgi:hypothetical protein